MNVIDISDAHADEALQVVTEDKNTNNVEIQPSNDEPKLKRVKLDNYFIRSSKDQKYEIDKQIARMIYSTNSSFSLIENEQFVILINMLRPGYQVPTRKAIGGVLLDELHNECEVKLKSELNNKTVSMAIDGWSNIHNEPIICSSITDLSGKTIISETIDTSGNAHNAEYLAITPIHLLANIIDPRFFGSNLTAEEELAMQYCRKELIEYLPNILNMKNKQKPFKLYLFDDQVIKNISPLTWWNSQNITEMKPLYNAFLTAVSSSAGVERVFSAFGIIHTKLRNRLGVEKAAKLVLLYKYYN